MAGGGPTFYPFIYIYLESDYQRRPEDCLSHPQHLDWSCDSQKMADRPSQKQRNARPAVTNSSNKPQTNPKNNEQNCDSP